ncbi:MAG: nuclease-related domain-containing protein [Woeseia sp.]
MNTRPPSLFLVLTGWLAAMPAYAADLDTAAAVEATTGATIEVVTGLTNVGSAMLVIAIAFGLLLTLFLRTSAIHAGRFVTARIGKRRIIGILRKKSANVLDDFILPGAYGGLTKIDYAMLTSGGIICIQTKHCNGIVFGGRDDPQWTNVDGMHRRKFLNPMIQNEGRTRALQKVVPTVPVANLVVFTGSVQFTAPLEKNVVHVRDLNSYIAKYVFGPCKIKDWDAVWMTMQAAALTDEDSRKDLNAQLSFS